MPTLYEFALNLITNIHVFQVQQLRLAGAPPKLVSFLDSTIGGFLPALATLTSATLLLTTIMLNALLVIYVERKLLARMHDRRGPSHVGYAGLLQNIADGLKLFRKEMVTPENADKLGYNIAPVLLTVSSFVAAAAIPISSNFFLTQLNASVLFVFAVLSLTPVGIFLAGWASNNKYTVIGGLRAVAQLVAYEIPIIFSIIGVVILSGSFNLFDIVAAQERGLWFILLQPIGFVLLIIAVLAEVERIPFDLPEAEAELVEGWTTEYGGIKFAMLQLAEYVRAYAGAALITILFLGGWLGPAGVPGEVWFFIKFYGVFALMIWIRSALPRVRIDQLLRIGWRRLLPLAVVNILIATVIVSFG